jgi:hypothetical protein
MTVVRPVISQRTLVALNWEVTNVQAFLDRFEPPATGERRIAVLGDTGEYVVIKRFPLPDRFRPDCIDLLLLVPDYPAVPPIGLYCLNRSNGRVIEQIETVFNAFRDRAFHDAPSIAGYTWICHHYANNRWRHVPHAPNRGDNIAKFLSDFFFKLAE